MRRLMLEQVCQGCNMCTIGWALLCGGRKHKTLQRLHISYTHNIHDLKIRWGTIFSVCAWQKINWVRPSVDLLNGCSIALFMSFHWWQSLIVSSGTWCALNFYGIPKQILGIDEKIMARTSSTWYCLFVDGIVFVLKKKISEQLLWIWRPGSESHPNPST